ncbi:Major facilitator superfamily protein [Striga hermonthica]|uniref:Major facilitator superfamily protein n=1 Tax=Striga hermonthica TaxID=68872 RepID=A0A9N7RAY2_STRHE|nr:Major facilitator superfamily protein [Striga hermonthica]
MTLAETGPETLTLFLVNLAGIMDNADEQLLPAVYKEVGESLHADPTQLGSLTFFKSFVQALCFPVAAYLAARHNRTHVIALGAFLWAAATFLVAISSTFTEVAVSRGLNGIGLALVIPSIQSLIADSTIESNRGTAFGWLHLTSSFGSVFGSLVAVLLAPTTILGLEGWRVAFHLVAALSILVGILVHLFARDPRYDSSRIKDNGQEPTKSFLGEEARSLLKEARDVIKVPSFRILVGQGVSGSFPWSALSFGRMWLELMGFSHGTTATIWSLFIVATSLGGLFGGKMGDFMARRLPDSGRIIMAQVSTGLAVPLAALLILGLPDDSSTAILHGVVFVVMGLVISWCVPATNNPIFAEIVPERARTSIYALDRSFETILSSFAPPVVGLLSQNVFGYKSVDSGNVETDKENARALGKALYVSIGIPFTICCLIYSFLHCTYPGDRDRARMASFIESQTRDIESDDSYILIRDEPNVPSEESPDCRENDEQT